MTWRDEARPIIAAVIARVGKHNKRMLRKALHNAYPFGVRQFHPYKVWCDEIREQTGENRKRAERRNREADRRTGQGRLFE
jgi:hypothetical protein